MKKESTSNKDRQEKICYVAVPIGDAEVEMDTSVNKDASSQRYAMGLLKCAKLLLVLSLVLCFAQVILDHHTSNFFHFEKHGRPCHHHVSFDSMSHDEHHHPPHHHPPHSQSFHHHDEHHMNPNKMGGMHGMESFHAAHDGITMHLPPPIVVESKNDNSESSDDSSDLDVWERIADSWNGGKGRSSDSLDSSDDSKDSKDLDVWERIADFWHGSEDSGDDDKDIPSSDSSESSDESSDLDIWERIADFWHGSNDRSKESVDSSDDNEDVWERFAITWKTFSSEGKQETAVASSDKK